MSLHSARRIPAARIDPINSEFEALAVASIAVSWPPRAQTIVILLDSERRGLTIVCVNDTADPDAMFEVLDRCFLSPDLEEFAALVLVTVRPGGSVEPNDVDRWFEASDECELVGLELVEWFVVVDRAILCPRVLIGESPRWTA